MAVGDKIGALFSFANSEEWAGYNELSDIQTRLSTDPDLIIPQDDEAFYQKNYTDIVTCRDREAPRLSALIADADASVESLKKDLVDSTKELEDKQKLLLFYQQLISRTSDQYLVSLASLLTEVYRMVYDDPSSRVELRMEDSRGRKVIQLRIIKVVGSREFVEDLKSQGGSVQNILGLLIQVYCILNLGLPRVLFIDEVLAALSNTVLRNMLDVFDRLHKELGFSFFIIDHAVERFEDYIDRLYTIKGGVYRRVTDVHGFIEDYTLEASKGAGE